MRGEWRRACARQLAFIEHLFLRPRDGIDKALPMILSGDPVSAQEALKLGLVDEIVEGDPIQGAIAFARRMLAEKTPLRRVRDLEDKLEFYRANPKAYDEVVAKSAKRTRGLDAPAAAVEAVRWSFELPMDEAEKRVREKFQSLRQGDQSKSQRHRARIRPDKSHDGTRWRGKKLGIRFGGGGLSGRGPHNPRPEDQP